MSAWSFPFSGLGDTPKKLDLRGFRPGKTQVCDHPSRVSVGVSFQMLAEEVFTVVIAVRRADYDMDMLPCRHISRIEMSGSDRSLMIELNENHRAVDPVIEDGILRHTANPCKVGLCKVLLDFGHSHPGVSFFQVADEEVDQIKQSALLGL